MKHSTFSFMWLLVVILSVLCGAATGWAQDGTPGAIDTGDTAWILVSSAFVLCMTLPGLALFYGGLVRSKNVLGTLAHTAVILCLISIVWVLLGYSLAFGTDVGGVIGSLEFLGSMGVGQDAFPGTGIPHLVFMVFQLMFAAITVALITGSFAERMKFTALLLFAVLWSVLIYSPLAHWVWGGGWLGEMGALDFAGGAVVHISSGFAALVCALVLGQRKGYGVESMLPHNLPMTVLGTGLLWFGVVRVQRGKRLGCQRGRGYGFCGHPYCGMRRWAQLDGRGMGADRQTHHARGSQRNHRGPGNHHARRRVRFALVGVTDRTRGRCPLLRRGCLENQTRVR